MHPTAAVVEPLRRHVELRNGDDDGEMVKRDVVLRSLAYSRGMKIGAIPTPKVRSGRSITVKFQRLNPARHTSHVRCDAVMIGRVPGLWHLPVVSNPEVMVALNILGGNFPSLTDDAFRLPH